MTSQTPAPERHSPVWPTLAVLISALCLGLTLAVAYVTVSTVHTRRSPRPDTLSVGSRVPSFRATDARTGSPVNISFRVDNRQFLFYAMSPACKWCEVNEASINALAMQTVKNITVVGLSITSDNISDYLLRTKYPFPVYTGLSDAVWRSYGITATPTSILTSSDGRVERIWEGAYVSGTKSDIERTLRIHLPAVAVDPPIASSQ